MLADYDAPRAAFAALCRPACDRRILLLRGTSGSGKTTLLTYCQQESATPILSIQLRGGTVGVAEIFARAGRRLTWERLPRFTHQVERLQGPPTVQIDRNALLGINNRITVALRAENPTDREERRTLLTDAWFDDVAALDQPLLAVFDTYEEAATEVQEWLSGPFLVRVADTAQMRVVVAGQQTPEAHNIEWGHCCQIEELYGVPEARYWLPVVEELNRHIPVRDPESWLAGVCHVYRGHPDDIIKVIKGLPLREARR